MAPSKNTPESELSESSTTRHEPACLMEMHDSLKHAEDDSADETSTTHHVPFLLAEELTSDPDLSLGAMKPVEEAPEQEGDEGQRELNVKRNEKGEEERQKSEELPLPPSPSPKSNSPQDAASPAEQEYYDQREEEELSLRIHKKVADIAAKAYRRASAQSAVLTQSKLQDIALIRMDELELGDFLGKGSFSDVHEITKISIKKQEGENDSDEKQNEQGGDGGQESKTGSIAGRPPGGRRSSLTNTSSRKLLAKNYCRHESGTFRYAVKFLKESIRSDPNKYAVGTADLVIEGMFLASLSHPNIIRVRGLPRGGVQSLVKTHRSELGENSVGKGYFLVLDRLFDTLGDRIYKEWVETHADKKDWMGGTVRSPKNKAERKMNLAERLRVAFDVCGALKYLHEKKIIYRDLKPENLGFDVRGDIKLFDLGLVKELNPNTEDKNGNYRLSMAGTPRYMAPEVGRYKPYNLSADVYSLSMLLYEVVTVSKPLRDFTYTQLKEDVFQSGYRPPLKKVWYKPMRNLIEAGWSQNPKKRPTMAVMYDELKTAYTTLGKVSVEQVNHSRRRSTFVSKKVDLVSVRHLVTRSSDVEENEVE